MHVVWLTLAIVATVAYHLIMKLTPEGVNPMLGLAVTYAVCTVVFVAGLLLVPNGPPIREGLQALNWTTFALTLAIVGLDIGYLMLYRSGFDVSLGQIVTQSAATLILLVAGIAFFREKLTAANFAGVALCVVGLWLITRK